MWWIGLVKAGKHACNLKEERKERKELKIRWRVLCVCVFGRTCRRYAMPWITLKKEKHKKKRERKKDRGEKREI